jgi:multidrug efflux pump subunit AcrA (membrane-fusion protein)
MAQVGVGATVLLPSAEGVVEGTVRAVSPGVDGQTRTGTLHADLPQPGSLKAGSYVEGRIAIGTGSVLTVPAASIVQRDGHPYVFTVDDKGIAHRLRVSTGTSEQGQVEIVQGLKAGQQVVEEGAGFLGDGDRVRVVPADAAAAKDSGA